MYEIDVRHNFETAHRLPHLLGKCESLHGHSWWVTVTVQADALTADGIVVEFGPYKWALRAWIDEVLDHGTVLGRRDPLAAILRENDCKVFTMKGWPTVEAVAELLARKAADLLVMVPAAAGARVTRVHLQETHVNGAAWVA